MRKTISLAVMAVTIAVPATASAATTKAQAKRAVRAEVRFEYSGGTTPTVSCRKLSKRKFNCRWETLTRADVSEGDTNGHSGIAYVRGANVRLVERDD